MRLVVDRFRDARSDDRRHSPRVCADPPNLGTAPPWSPTVTAWTAPAPPVSPRSPPPIA